MLEDHLLYLIATDGGALSEPVELRELLLVPGERAEVLVRGEREPGQYRLLNLPYNRGGMMGGGGMMDGGMMGSGMMQRSPVNTPEARSQTLVTLTYSGQVSPLPIPQILIPVEALPEPQTVRQITLSHGMAPGQGMVFTIDGKTFHHDRIDTQVHLDTVEDWEIASTGMMMGFDHPFHLYSKWLKLGLS
jgi:FtsP/CotA-like multicopper oxidase with cupredoxin domain